MLAANCKNRPDAFDQRECCNADVLIGDKRREEFQGEEKHQGKYLPDHFPSNHLTPSIVRLKRQEQHNSYCVLKQDCCHLDSVHIVKECDGFVAQEHGH